ncbi:MAG: ATP synthase subunit I [Paraburkholderia sp.]|uniref:N-ATPase subunit AtpR n=1 Tax=Paraburkholderia sp. TaxID=1926495 RepID=UPI003C55ED29
MTPNFLLTTEGAQAAIGLFVGILAGLVHFTTLRWNVRLLSTGSSAKAIALQIARLGAIAAIFFVLARTGAWALLGGAGGVLFARHAVIRRVRSAS